MALRKLIFKDTETGEEKVLPVTPQSYEIEHGRNIEKVDMHPVGEVNLAGLPLLFEEPIECLLPAQDYPFNNADADTNPFTYVEWFETRADEGTVLRFVVSDTPVNCLVLIGSFSYTEKDGTGDLYATIRLHRYRELEAEQTVTNTDTGNTSRAQETEPTTQDSYTVESGDTLWSISKKFYGDATLCYKLATANGISNPNILQVGQVLTIPDKTTLEATAATYPPVTKTTTSTRIGTGTTSTGTTSTGTTSSGSETVAGTWTAEQLEVIEEAQSVRTGKATGLRSVLDEELDATGL